MPFSFSFRPNAVDSPLLAVLARSGSPLVSLARGDLAELCGLTPIDLFDELDRLELAGRLRWQSRDDEDEVIEITRLPEPPASARAQRS